MNALNTLIKYFVELGGDGLRMAIYAGMYAGLFAAMVLLANLLLRRWLTAAQKSLLWALVLGRLLMPWAPSSVLSLQNLLVPTAADSVAREATYWSPAPVDASTDRPRGYAAPLPAAAIERATEVSWEGFVGMLLPLAWIFGGALVLGWTAVVHWQFSCRVKRAPICEDPRLVALWTSCRGQIGLQRTIPIVSCDELQQPALMGLFRSKLLLPTHVTDLDDDQLRMIMLHELAHVRRHDIALNWIIVLIRAIHWWNPVYWLAVGRFCSLREQACDAFVIRRMGGQRGRTYSELLLTLAEREPVGFGWRVTLPASILGFLSSFFRRRAVRERLQALRFAGLTPSRSRTVVVASAIALGAISGLTDAMPAVASSDDFDWFPTVTLDSTAAGADPEIDLGPIVTRSYDVQNVLARIDADSERENFKFLIAYILQTQSKTMGLSLQHPIPIGSTPTTASGTDRNRDSSGSSPAMYTYTLDEARLTVQAPTSLQDELAENLKAWEQSGVGQICVECRFVTVNRDIASAAGVSWQYLEAFSEEAEESLPSELPAGMPHVRAEAIVSEYLPVVVANLSKPQAQALIQAAQGNRRSNVLQAPKVTLFNGQMASVVDLSQTPFVVGIRTNDAGEQVPKVRVFEQGSKITMRVIHSSDRQQIHLKGRMEFRGIADVHEARAMLGGKEVALQIPCAKRCRIDVACTVEDGQSVLIGCVPTYEKKQILYVLLTMQDVSPVVEAAN
jgi:bla regulator protein BlaR1